MYCKLASVLNCSFVAGKILKLIELYRKSMPAKQKPLQNLVEFILSTYSNRGLRSQRTNLGSSKQHTLTKFATKRGTASSRGRGINSKSPLNSAASTRGRGKARISRPGISRPDSSRSVRKATKIYSTLKF